MRLENITSPLTEAQVKTDRELVTQIQANLRGLGLYPGGKFIDGDFGPRSRSAVKQFCDFLGLPFPVYDRIFAQNLLNCKCLPEVLSNSNNEQVYQKLLAIGRATRLSSNEDAAFLHRGIQNSKYLAEINQYPQRLAVKHEANFLPSNYVAYPNVGVIPHIDTQSLGFLDNQITEACVCLGKLVNGQMQTRWLGKNARSKRQFWSVTKIIPLVNTVCEANRKFPDIDIETCYITNSNYPFIDLALDVVTYRHKIASSNQVAAMLKMFQTPYNLENWLKKITGNQNLEFRSGYGESPFLTQPKLIDRNTGRVLLTAAGTSLEVDKNYVSAYDLTRLMSMLAWHLHLNQNARLPGGQWHSLSNLVQVLGHDRARYIEVAIETLGLEKAVTSPVIISKLGNGYSQTRNQNEITYVGYVQFLDTRSPTHNPGDQWRSLAITLRGVTSPGSWIELDARMAASVTEIIRRVVTENIV